MNSASNKTYQYKPLSEVERIDVTRVSQIVSYDHTNKNLNSCVLSMSQYFSKDSAKKHYRPKGIPHISLLIWDIKVICVTANNPH